MAAIPASLRREVVDRAAGRCEYCQLSQAGQEAEFHIDHVVPRASRGETVSRNLALACVSCSLHKAARRTVVDPQSNRYVPMFHPRRDRWHEHFRWDGVRVIGLTPTGRATIAALEMNRAVVLAIRAEEVLRGRHPPPSTAGET